MTFAPKGFTLLDKPPGTIPSSDFKDTDCNCCEEAGSGEGSPVEILEPPTSGPGAELPCCGYAEDPGGWIMTVPNEFTAPPVPGFGSCTHCNERAPPGDYFLAFVSEETGTEFINGQFWAFRRCLYRSAPFTVPALPSPGTIEGSLCFNCNNEKCTGFSGSGWCTAVNPPNSNTNTVALICVWRQFTNKWYFKSDIGCAGATYARAQAGSPESWSDLACPLMPGPWNWADGATNRMFRDLLKSPTCNCEHSVCTEGYCNPPSFSDITHIPP